MGAAKLTPEQDSFLRERYATTPNRRLAEEFTERFGRRATTSSVACFGQRNGLVKEAVRFSPDEDAWLSGFIPGHDTAEAIDAFEERFGWRPSRNQMRYARQRLGVRCGVHHGRFEGGRSSPWKGGTWDEMGIPRETQERMRERLWKPGETSEHARRNTRDLLDTRTEAGGKVKVCVRPRNAKTTGEDWISYARLVWMQANGRDWPDGHRAVFADHDSSNFDPGNIVAVPEELAILVHTGMSLPYHDRPTLEASVAFARLIRARAAAERALDAR